MSTAHSLLGAAAPAFDEPIEMLDACHGRIQAQIETLRRLAAHLPAHGADRAAQEAARGVLRYFSVAAPHHHADEEEDLFPMLREVASGDQVAVVDALIGRILDDHRRMDVVRDAVLARLAPIAEGTGGPLPEDEVAALAGIYLAHIDLETRELLPLARRLLDADRMRELGRRMSARRGVTFPES